MRLTAKCKAQNEIVEDLGDFFCTSGYIDSRTLTFSVLTTHKNGITGCSSAFLSGKNLFIGSWSSKSVAKYHLWRHNNENENNYKILTIQIHIL